MHKQFFSGIAAAGLITTIAAGAVANEALPLSMIGHHLRIQSFAAHLQPCAALKCPNYHGYNFIDPGTGYTILGFAQDKGNVFVKVRLDDGRTGFLWELTPQHLASQEKAQNACQNKQPAQIGMTEDEVLKSQWGQSWSRQKRLPARASNGSTRMAHTAPPTACRTHMAIAAISISIMAGSSRSSAEMGTSGENQTEG